MNTAPRTPPEAWRLQMLKHLQASPSLSQRQLAGQMGVSLGKANYCLRALVEKGLVKLGNFRKNQNKRQYAYLLIPSGLEASFVIQRWDILLQYPNRISRSEP